MNAEEQLVRTISGGDSVIAWFGWWPSFHDAEVVSLLLDREAESILRIHVFNMRGELSAKGHYKTTEHAIVTFVLSSIQVLELADFNQQNVISGLKLSRTDDGFQIDLGCCYGLCGRLRAASVRLEFEPGMPTGSIYA